MSAALQIRGKPRIAHDGRYLEAGIKEMDGYAAEYFLVEPEFAVRFPRPLERVGVLLEPASFAAKVWSHIERIGLWTAAWHPRRALVTGAGPIALLAALLGVQRGVEVCVLDRHDATTKKDLVLGLGAEYSASPISDLAFRPDVLIECTGLTGIGVDAMAHALPNAVRRRMRSAAPTPNGSIGSLRDVWAAIVGRGIREQASARQGGARIY